jgi:hypothetical protein
MSLIAFLIAITTVAIAVMLAFLGSPAASWVRGLIVPTSFGLAATPADAQAPGAAADQAQVGFGYVGEEGFPVGWYVSLSALPKQMLAVVGQVSGEYQTLTPEGGTRTRRQTFSFLDGLPSGDPLL